MNETTIKQRLNRLIVGCGTKRLEDSYFLIILAGKTLCEHRKDTIEDLLERLEIAIKLIRFDLDETLKELEDTKKEKEELQKWLKGEA